MIGTIGFRHGWSTRAHAPSADISRDSKGAGMKSYPRAISLVFAIILVIFVILAAADAGMVIPAGQRCSLGLAWFGCLLANHEGLSGGLIGGGGALFAAWIAWRAVMDQIRSDRELATHKEDITYEAICTELDRVIGILDMIWRVVDAALAKHGKDNSRWRDNGRAVLLAIYPGARGLTEIVEAELRNGLDPIRRSQLANLLASLQWLCQIIDSRDNDRLWLENVRTMPSHFNRYLEVFAPERAQRFQTRTKAPVDHRDLDAHLEPTVSQFEKTGNL